MTQTAPPAPQIDAQLGPPPFRRPHYAAETFYRFDAKFGSVTTAYGQRIVRVSADFLAALHAALERETGQRAGEILYGVGRHWGTADMQAFSSRATEEFGAAPETVHMDVLLETWWWPLRAGGWGAWSFDFRRAAQRQVFLEVRDSAEAHALAGAQRPACFLYAGYFAGGLSVLARRELACVELQCAACGAATCQFLFSTPAQTQQAQQWREAGEPAAEIVRKLTAAV